MKKCPYCAEEIQDEAIKCKHCGEFIARTKEDKDRFKELKNDEKMLAMLCHLGTLLGFVVPFGNFLVPLIIWLTRKEDYPLVEDQGKESLNFQISLLAYTIAGFILSFVIIGILFLIVVWLFGIIQIIKASISANKGELYRYPFCIRFLK